MSFANKIENLAVEYTIDEDVICEIITLAISRAGEMSVEDAFYYALDNLSQY